ncbi:MAG: nitrogenase molybdenum-iron cofactor biosynthesis protein [Thermoproteota archaeon]|uniref:FeMo cofactor biosynthesis protein NifB n=1 Tax=Candidatus Methanodesulfokora washburnensis TaxID=2478471 RepID=A0A3R9X191_9CREN|nr:radical SAM protein [Candidatus Methanodesulfokores washburnensis]RSN72827.1 radical SAM protein [Candidatus Methanodesulfokores washburnensis]RZN63763.1 MAG: radical SAM protein [Candidatus Methanodesulfokores washburnensis]TDA40890.1 MAG: nitrogenase molybdenum-iron cofactor biosynthesis protein [Candidatus Korarchaeota archaeon]
MKNESSEIEYLISVHPCYSHLAHFRYARAHLPVASLCNIQCNYCSRKIDKSEFRPGVARKIVRAEDALNIVEDARKRLPLKVAAIAGPGEVLANEESFRTLRMIHEKYPELILCIATNGLLLPRYIDELRRIGVKAVTVTVNAISPEIGEKIYEWVSYDGKIYRGLEGAKILIENQLNGIEKAWKAGMAVKINTVLIPEVNDKEIESIARECAERGAFIMNIIPLIPLYRFSNIRRPTCEELNEAREKASKYIRIFRLCRLCSADAVGIPGKEKSPYMAGYTERLHG